MNSFTDFLPTGTLFSADNPWINGTRQAHKRAFESLDKAAHLQLDFARDMLDLNRKRFESLYAGSSLNEVLNAQKELVLETGTRGVELLEEAKLMADEIQVSLKESANEFWAGAKAEAKPAGTVNKKAKAA